MNDGNSPFAALVNVELEGRGLIWEGVVGG